MGFHRSSHSVWECKYHLVWSTKYRKRVMTLAHEREYCEEILRRTSTEYGFYIQAMEVDEDHVHLYIEIPPQCSVGEAARILKSVSARMMFKRFPYFKKKIWCGKMWGASYFVRTVGKGVTAEMVKKYIEMHADKGLEPAQAERWLAANLDYDPE